MLDLGRHAEFIWASYAAWLLVTLGLVLWLVLRGRQLSRELADLEARGARRRSGAPPAPRFDQSADV
jgi:heme exporter protein D